MPSTLLPTHGRCTLRIPSTSTPGPQRRLKAMRINAQVSQARESALLRQACVERQMRHHLGRVRAAHSCTLPSASSTKTGSSNECFLQTYFVHRVARHSQADDGNPEVARRIWLPPQVLYSVKPLLLLFARPRGCQFPYSTRKPRRTTASIDSKQYVKVRSRELVGCSSTRRRSFCNRTIIPSLVAARPRCQDRPCSGPIPPNGS